MGEILKQQPATPLLALALTFLCGCATSDYVMVRYIEVAPEEMHRACPNPRLIGTWAGCTVRSGNGLVEIRALRPRNVADHQALATIGHEFYCHAWLRQDHYDDKDVRREPARDCVAK